MELLDVVVLVASATGGHGLTALLDDLPLDLPAAIVVQQHVAGRRGVTAPSLRRSTMHEVTWAADGDTLSPGRVMVCPPAQRIEVRADGTCALTPALGNTREHPHDGLLRSLADAYGERAVAVVLGNGEIEDGGVTGAAAVREAGGVVIAQNERTGAHLVLPVHGMARMIASTLTGAASH